MKKHNKKEQMRKKDCVILSCMFAAIAGVLFHIYVTLYKHVYVVMNIYNINMLVGCLVIFTITGVLLTRNNDRYYINIFINIILGTGTYTLIMFMYSGQFFVLRYRFILLIILAVLINSIAVAVVNRHRTSVAGIIKTSMLRNRKLSAFLLAGLLLGLYIISSRGISEFGVSSGSKMSEAQALSRLSVAMDDSTWNEKSMKEKMDAAQMLVGVICGELGIEDYPAVKIEKLNENKPGSYDDFTKLGTYNDLRNEITLDTKLMNGEPEDIIETVAHETYHANQNNVVSVYHIMDSKRKSLFCLTRRENIIASSATMSQAKKPLRNI